VVLACRTFGGCAVWASCFNCISSSDWCSFSYKVHLANHFPESEILEQEVPVQSVAPSDVLMLRITIDEGKDAVVLRLEGQLIGPWVEDVEQCWRKAFETLGSRSVQVNLSAVNFVDASGGALLIRMHAAGFRLAGSTPATGHLLDQIQDERIWGEN
jgi:anti-anti-sigma regulatory factor